MLVWQRGGLSWPGGTGRSVLTPPVVVSGLRPPLTGAGGGGGGEGGAGLWQRGGAQGSGLKHTGTKLGQYWHYFLIDGAA